jgi:hypothetical protein
MSICMRLYVVPDSDIRAFTGAPRTLQKWLRQRRPDTDMWLQDRWRDLDAILAGKSSVPGQYSPLTPQGADFTYPAAADHGAHALSSSSTEALLHAIAEITPPQVEAYLRGRSAAHASQTGGPPTSPSVELASGTDDLLLHLACLQEACALAVAKRYGLLMALWEL